MKFRMLAISLAVAVLLAIVLTRPMHNVAAIGATEAARTTNTCNTTTAFDSTCSVSVTWPTAFSDTNYTVSCTPENGQPSPPASAEVFVYVSPSSKTTTGVSMTIQNLESGVDAYLKGIDCVAVHD